MLLLESSLSDIHCSTLQQSSTWEYSCNSGHVQPLAGRAAFEEGHFSELASSGPL